MTGELRDAFARAAELLPDTPGRFESVMVRRRRRQRRRASAAMALSAFVVVGGVIAVDSASTSRPPTAVTSAATPTPPPAKQDPLALVGRWHVDGAGITPGTDVILGNTLLLFQPCGVQEGAWKADGVDGLFVGDVDGGDQGCYLPTRVDPLWLDRARTFVVQGQTRQLFDVSGALVATLRPGATPTVGPNRLPQAADEPTISPSQRAAAHDPAPLPGGVRPPTAAELERRFVPAVDRSGKAFVSFDASGRWHGSDGCNGGGGGYALGTGGRLLATEGNVTLVGCSGSPADYWVNMASRVGLIGRDLVFYDTHATELGRVHPS